MNLFLRQHKKMEYRGFEPLASTMRMLRAPNCANTPYHDYITIFFRRKEKFEKNIQYTVSFIFNHMTQNGFSICKAAERGGGCCHKEGPACGRIPYDRPLSESNAANGRIDKEVWLNIMQTVHQGKGQVVSMRKYMKQFDYLAYDSEIEYNGGSEWQMRFYNGMMAFTQLSRLN